MTTRNRSARPPDHLFQRVLPVLLAGAALLGACEDPFKLKATFENESQPFFVHALSGSELPYVTALYLPVRQVARVDGSFAFDVAFDLNAAGDIVLLPVGLVGQSPGGQRRVGIQRATAAYDAVTEAPTAGYAVDTATVIKRGETAIVQAQEAQCQVSITPYLYAKIVIDSVDVVQRTMTGRVTINTNCGFRSLAKGLPAF